MAELESISSKLDELRAGDPGQHLFGASHHRYEIGSPADQSALDHIEELVGTRLPEDYRAFITTIADGAPGPYYGIHSLGHATGLVEDCWGAHVLGQDSPLSGDVAFRELLEGPADWDEHVARLENDPSYPAGYERLQNIYQSEPWSHGRLPIADIGCGSWAFLVLRGSRQGTMWVDATDGSTGLYCLEVNFLTWYKRWLDDALDRVARADFAPVNAHYSDLKFGDNPRYRLVNPL
ncbi:SMI1/KNR4 family protein [Streptomyces sp. NPDC056534]|uniref:SMI1/KNR4 family protein n=1 Tax=Streptomyces sp. NPDC056534 TaxID=3345857 RepID=UPI003681A719